MKKSFLLMLSITITLIITSCINNKTTEKKIYLDFQREIVSLNGTWEYIEDQMEETIWKSTIAKSQTWTEVSQPGYIPYLPVERRRGEVVNTKCIWLRRTFEINKEQAEKNVVLKWGRVQFGAKVWLNEKEVDNHITMGPNTVLIPSDIIKEGINTIVLRTNGWGSIERSEDIKVTEKEINSFPLFPSGASSQGWGGKAPSIVDDIWLEFYSSTYMKYILAIPDVNNNKVTFRIWLDAENELPNDLQVKIKCRFQDEKEAQKTFAFPLNCTKEYQEVTCDIDDPNLWWPDNPVLYYANLELTTGNILCDETSFSFGMRQIEVVNGNYMLNNKRIKLNGSNMLNEWNWGPKFADFPRKYIVDEARNMNLNSFRTHTVPPITQWLDIADKNGIMFLAEMPLLFNYQDPQFTEEQWEVYRKNTLDDEKGWITKIWNHPSIVVWVISNESPFDSIWEKTVLRDMVLSHDPSRPVLRTGERTQETNDWHPCGNFNDMDEGKFFFDLEKQEEKGNESQTVSNSEYMNLFTSWENISLKYLGDSVHPYLQLSFAEIAMEHTELMRQHEFDMILPYMYAGWTGTRGAKWHPEYPTPMAASLHSCMSPVLASMDIWHRNFNCGQEITVPVHMMNDLYDEVKATINVYITTSDPVFVPHKDSLRSAIWEDQFEYTYAPLSHEIKDLKIELPEKAGKYYLSVVMNRDGDRPVTSQRIVRTFELEKPQNDNFILLLGGNSASDKWLNENSYIFSTEIKDLNKADVIVIWDALSINNKTNDLAELIKERVYNSAKLVIVDQDSLNWDNLLDIEYGDKYGKTRGFICKGAESHTLFDGIDPEYFKRWNGLPFEIANRELKGDYIESAQKLWWAGKPEYDFVVSQQFGTGEIIISQLIVRNRINKEKENYDPVAEQILHNLLK